MVIYEHTKRLAKGTLYLLENHNMSTHIARFSESTLKWRKICEKIFGSRHGFTWRLSPEDGKIYFSKNGIELIKANAFIVATTWFTGKSKLNWLWAWGKTKNRQLIMDRLPEENRFTTADVSEYEKDLGDYKSYFQKNAFQLDLSKKSDQVVEAQLRAYTLDILDGQYVYEAEIGYGSGRMNVIFVIAGSKSIKQRVPEPVPEPTEEQPSNQNDEASDNGEEEPTSNAPASNTPTSNTPTSNTSNILNTPTRSQGSEKKSVKSPTKDDPDEWDW